MLTVVQAPPIRELPSRNALTSSDEHKNSSFLNKRHYYGLYTITSSPPCDQTTPNITHDVVFIGQTLDELGIIRGAHLATGHRTIRNTTTQRSQNSTLPHFYLSSGYSHRLFSFRMQVREGGRVHLRINLTKRAF